MGCGASQPTGALASLPVEVAAKSGVAPASAADKAAAADKAGAADKAPATPSAAAAAPTGSTQADDPASIPTRFVRLDKLRAHGSLPRFGSQPSFVHPVTGEPNANLCQPREEFDEARTFFVFISHRWARPGQGAKGHPDDPEHHKFQLVLDALDMLRNLSKASPVPQDLEVAVWMDYCCIDQDGAPASELNNLGNLIAACDALITPIIDPEHASWEYPALWADYFAEYCASGWQEYWSRGWCRVEAMIAAVRPVADGRAALYRGAMAAALEKGRRPHLLFGAKEQVGPQHTGRRPPLFLPPLLNSTFDRYAPEDGALTKEADRVAVRNLSEEARRLVKEQPVGFVGEYQGKGDGHGCYNFVTGDWYEGQMREGINHGKGRMCWATGDVYEGEYQHGDKHGHGKMSAASGMVYEGQWHEGRQHGEGSYEFLTGESYRGGFKNGLIHGAGRYAFAHGDVYEGQWEAGSKQGAGTFTYASGDVYEGEFRNDVRNGHGVERYVTGEVYEGEYVDGEMHGRGAMRNPDGSVLHDGEWADGQPVGFEGPPHLMAMFSRVESVAQSDRASAG